MDNKELIEARKQIENFFDNFKLQFEADKLYKEFISDIDNGNYESLQHCELFKILDKIMLSNDGQQMKRIIPKNTKFYRARIISPDDYQQNYKGISIDSNFMVTGYDEENSKEAPIGVSGEGRNNILGMSYLYVAEDEVTACTEIKSGMSDLISLAEFQLNVPLTVIDFSKNKKFSKEVIDECGIALGTFMTNLMFQYSKPVNSVREYRATQVVSDYFRKMGVDGVCYKSFFTWKDNFTFFNSHSSLIKFISSKIVMHQYSKKVFYDINEKRILESINEEVADYNSDDIIKKKLEKIRKGFINGNK